MSIIEILDSENIKSTLEPWINECEKFKAWYCKLGIQEIDELEMQKAYLKLNYKILAKMAIQITLTNGNWFINGKKYIDTTDVEKTFFDEFLIAMRLSFQALKKQQS
jgi:hypothetical protein